MTVNFNADEIFEMAEQIERNGARFYRRAAEGIADERSKQLLLDLAAMEDTHLKVFSLMRSSLPPKERQETTFDPQGDAARYLQAMADGRIFDMRKDPSETLTGKETAKDILRTAIGLERDSIAFYVGMKELVPENLGKGKLDGIIKQEMNHVSEISNALATLK